MTSKNIRDLNPLEHLTSDMAKSRYNYESILNGIVEWSNSKLDNVTVRLATDVYPYYVDYTFPTKRTYENTSSGIVDVDSTSGMVSYDLKYDIPALYDPSAVQCDNVKVRLTVGNAAGGTWGLYAIAVIYDESGSTTSTRKYCKNLYVTRSIDGRNILCRTTKEVAQGDAWSDSPLSSDSSSNWMYVVETYDPKKSSFYSTRDDIMVSYGGAVYRITGSVESLISPDAEGSGWTRVCSMLSSVSTVSKYNMYYDGAEFYIYIATDASLDGIPSPTDDTEGLYWTGPVHLVYINGVSVSTTFRWSVDTDISGLVMRMMPGSASDGTIPDISMAANLEINSGTVSDNTHKGLTIFDTCNYSLWPTSQNAVWVDGDVYSTDTNIGTSYAQEYTAKMVFHHSNSDVTTMNIVNYNGPDLDQGLAIYLPVRDKTYVDGVETYKEPCDGYTFEFLFRIWPNTAYNGQTTADLIINKAQIYVYSVETSDELDGSAPIAKFSMARVTNFYVFAENVGVPNRPVLYKAKFVYSAANHAWETYDYYQLPDHIFLSPKGFVDPSVRSDDTYGVETAGFPLFQDPFSGMDLSRVMVDETYSNRMK